MEVYLFAVTNILWLRDFPSYISLFLPLNLKYPLILVNTLFHTTVRNALPPFHHVWVCLIVHDGVPKYYTLYSDALSSYPQNRVGQGISRVSNGWVVLIDRLLGGVAVLARLGQVLCVSIVGRGFFQLPNTFSQVWMILDRQWACIISWLCKILDVFLWNMLMESIMMIQVSIYSTFVFPFSIRWLKKQVNKMHPVGFEPTSTYVQCVLSASP